jgi:hypothetical protein
MKKSIAAVALAAGVLSTAACGPGGGGYNNASYCVNQSTGMVMDPNYCQVGYPGYNPMMYDLWTGNTYGHSYRPGVVIQHNYFVSGTKINPSNSSARRAAGLPAGGKVSNGYSAPARSQSGPNRPSGGGSVTKSYGGGSSKSFGGSTSKSFGGGGTSSSRSSGFSSGGRK